MTHKRQARVFPRARKARKRNLPGGRDHPIPLIITAEMPTSVRERFTVGDLIRFQGCRHWFIVTEVHETASWAVVHLTPP